ncbi:unnamed protein product, partial [Taenia asiatica]|uniref:Uncharacterized protein n=1 Tax=Taenia asiatica TaxID=60517 RepID=A0A0R3W0A0_TAEAS
MCAGDFQATQCCEILLLTFPSSERTTPSLSSIHHTNLDTCWQFADQFAHHRREGKPPPLLHDVIIHYGERLAVDESVNQIPAAIRAIHGTKSPETIASPPVTNDATATVTTTAIECCNASANPPTQFAAPVNSIRAHGDSASDMDADTGPISLILVIGTSLTVLRFYTFLWPHGLRRCLGAGTKGGGGSTRSPKRPRLGPDSDTSTTTTT